MNRIRQLLSDAAAAFGRLQPRERGLVALAGLAVVAFLVAGLTVSVSNSIKQRETRIRTKLEQLEEVNRLTAGYRAAEAARAEAERKLKGPKVQLFSYLEDLAKKKGLEIPGMSDKGTAALQDSTITESSVEVTFTRISLDKLMKFLAEVESSPGVVKVTRLSIRLRSDEPVLDASLVVSTFQLGS